jgi:hypothetical protein
MKRFIKFTNEELMNRETELILEFANMTPTDHRFGVDVRLHVMQPGDNEHLQHGPRVKVFKTKPGPDFTITLEEIPRVIGDYTKVIPERDKNILLDKIRIYRTAFLKFWNDSGMAISELKEIMDEIDRKG